MTDPVFYFSTPVGTRTGGPEASHQLADAIHRRGYRSVLVPMWNFRGKTPHPEYDVYQYELADRIADPANAILILSEVSPIESMRELRAVPPDRTWLWWLSVNNNPDPRARKFAPSSACCRATDPLDRGPSDDLPEAAISPRPRRATDNASASLWGLTKEAWTRTFAPYSPGRNPKTFGVETLSLVYNRRVLESGIGFLAQSAYARGFCRSVLGQDAMPVTDYLRRPAIDPISPTPTVVLYNGAKGYSMIREVVPLVPEVEFRPIQNMTYVEVCQALQAAAAYVEVGVPPGRDRLPREAAHFGTPVITLGRGGAFCWDDFPLPDPYRVPFTDDWAPVMAQAVRRVLADPAEARREQAGFRAWVADDRTRFETEVDRWMEAALSSM